MIGYPKNRSLILNKSSSWETPLPKGLNPTTAVGSGQREAHASINTSLFQPYNNQSHKATSLEITLYAEMGAKVY